MSDAFDPFSGKSFSTGTSTDDFNPFSNNKITAESAPTPSPNLSAFTQRGSSTSPSGVSPFNQEAPAAKPQPYYDMPGRIKSVETGLGRAGVNIANQPVDLGSMLTNAGRSIYDYFNPEREEVKTDFRQTPREATRQRQDIQLETFKQTPEGIALLGMGSLPGSAQMKSDMNFYEPQNEGQRRIAEDVETGTTYAGSSPLSRFGTPARALVGAGLSEASRGAQDTFPKVAPFIPVLGMLAGETFGAYIGQLTNAQRRTTDALKEAYLFDVKSGNLDPSKYDPNTPITELEFKNPNKSALRKLVKQQSGLSTEIPDELTQFNATAKSDDLSKGLAKDIEESFGDAAGLKMNRTSDIQDYINKVEGAETDRLYDIARNSDPGKSVPVSIFGDLANQPNILRARKLVEEQIQNSRRKGNFKIPTDDDPTGNFDYWDKVYQQLRDTGGFYGNEIPVTKMSLENNATSAHDLKEILDQHMTIPGTERSLSAEARGQAKEYYGANNAMEVGEKFFLENPASDLKAREGERIFNSQSDDQKQAAAYGMLNAMNKFIQDDPKNGISNLADRFQNDETFNRRLQQALVKKNSDGTLDYSSYDMLRGKVMGAATRQSLPPFDLQNPITQNPSWRAQHPNLVNALIAGVPTALTATAGYLTDIALNSNLMSPAVLLTTGALGAAGYTTKTLTDSTVRRAANDIILKMSTGRLADLQALSKLTRTNPLYGAIYTGLTKSVAADQSQSDITQDRNRMGRATGGRAGKDPKARAMQLINMVDRIKKEQGNKTKPLLNLDDTTVAKALAIANRGI